MKKVRRVTAPPASLPAKGLALICRVLLALVLVLGALILAGTFFAVYRGPGSEPLFSLGGDGKAPDQGGRGDKAAAREPAAVGIFTGIGRLRIPVAAAHGESGGAEKATLILSIAFPYPLRDRAFTEELAARVGDFRRIAADYFSSLPAEELRNPDEENIKAELLRRYNFILRLGNIEVLYFNDLLIFE